MVVTNNLIELGKAVIDTEIEAITTLKSRIDQRFADACEFILNCKGRTIVIGMGKSGHIGNKIAATLASTGTPAFFVHPGEANHGDMGMITTRDVVIAISNSGETPEILSILPILLRQKIPLISLCGKLKSTIAKAASINLDTSVQKEACPLGLAPTASTTATLVMGDALAIALLECRGFTADDFARFHPGGSLGRRLLLRINDIMHKDDKIPLVKSDVNLQQALFEITHKRFGTTGIVNAAGQLIGVYTDGDLRRTLEQESNPLTMPIDQLMTRNCRIIQANMIAAEALRIMEEHKITSLFVTDSTQKPIGIVHMHDLLIAGVA